ncbi:hypothetical protein [Paenibacillus massiliensis]|uniref:hypothetical protein n=1 Tax=Paenibacillus massiliensis TaxID=225917 RepID=UPI0012EB3D8D|nr:hypothetical protein [Paenibacillus massiliensis]
MYTENTDIFLFLFNLLESGELMRTVGKAIVLGLLLVLAGMVMYFAVGAGN